MRSPTLKQGKILIASVQGSLSDADLLQFRDDLIAMIRRHRSTGVVIDVTLLDVMASFAARTLRGITQMTGLRRDDRARFGRDAETSGDTRMAGNG